MAESPTSQDPGLLIEGLKEELENRRSSITELAKKANDVASTSKPSILLLITTAFKDFQTIAESVAGDYDLRAKQDPTVKASIPSTLISSLENALTQSSSASEQVRSSLLKVCKLFSTRKLIQILNHSHRFWICART